MTDMPKRVLRYSVYCVCTLLFFWLFFTYLLDWTAPFILSFIISRIIEAPVTLLERRLSLPRRAASFICTALFFLAVAFLLKAIIFRGFDIIHQTLISLPDASTLTQNLLTAFKRLCDTLFNEASPQIFSLVQKLISGSISIPIRLRDKLLTFTSSAAGMLPDAFLFLVTLTVSSYFFSSDYPAIRDFLINKLPAALLLRLKDIRANISDTVLRYIKALLILAAITWAELSLGFLFLKIDNAIISAFFIACLDALPVFGSGFVLIPWAIGALVNGAFTRAIGLSALYLAVTLIRNLLEPKIIGGQTGLHPLISLAAIYIGLHIFGAYGLLMPLLLSFLRQSLRPHKCAAAE